MTSIAAVIEVVERAVVRRRTLLKPREPSPRTLWVDIDLDVLQWDSDSEWHTRPAVAFRAARPLDEDPATNTSCHRVSVAESSTSGTSAVAAGV